MADKGKPVIDYNLCMACGCCIQACPFSYLVEKPMSLDKKKYKRPDLKLVKPYPVLREGEKCNGCGLCVTACPIDCMAVVEPAGNAAVPAAAQKT